MVFQNPDNQIVGNTLAEDVGFGLENLGISSADIWDKIDEMLELTGLAAYKYSNTSRISGGQKQRLSIARAIAKHPQVFIFDDSFSALDYKTDVTLRRALAEKTSGSTVLIVAQRISTILHAEQIIVLDEGKVAGKGTHAELLKNCPVYREIAESQLSRKELEAALNEQTDGKEDQIHG